jgi:hypothetical protein
VHTFTVPRGSRFAQFALQPQCEPLRTFPHAGSDVERWSEFEESSPEQNRDKNVCVGDGDLFDSSRFSGDATLDRPLRRKSESTGGTRHWPEAGVDHQGAVP